MSNEPASLTLRLLRDMRVEMGEIRFEMATKSDVADLRAEMGSLHADVASDILLDAY